MSQGPDIASMLAGLGGQGGPPQGAPPQGPPPDQGGGEGDHAQKIRDLLAMARDVAASADDDEEAADFEKITSIIAGILAKQQKQQHELLQGKMPPSAMVKALSG